MAARASASKRGWPVPHPAPGSGLVLELPECPPLDLAVPLPRETEPLANLLQGMPLRPRLQLMETVRQDCDLIFIVGLIPQGQVTARIERFEVRGLLGHPC